jgi:hypothetical protein
VKFERADLEQGCQIYLDTIHQNGRIYQINTKLPNGLIIYQIDLKIFQNDHKIYQRFPF